jgi:ankyrin repeat protein
VECIGCFYSDKRSLILMIPSLLIGSLMAFAVPAGMDARLAEAAMKRDTASIRSLLQQKVDVNAPGKDGTPALHWVVRVDDLETANLLLRAGANVKFADRYGVTPIYLACSNGNAAMIKLLLDAGADPNTVDPTGETALMTAAKIGSLESIKTLLDAGAKVDTVDATYRQTALMIAVRENHTDIVRVLVERGADVNAQTRTGQAPGWVLPNSVAGFGFGKGIIRGGLPADRGSRYFIPGGLTPLLYAARDGRLEPAKILLAAGANLEHKDPNDITPLLMAISNNHVDVARFLIEKGAAINVSDWYGRTPLWTAVEVRNMDFDNGTIENGIDREPLLGLIQLLLDKGADPNPRTKESIPIRRFMLRGTGTLEWVDFTGQTPFLRAAYAGDLSVMRLLLKHGADPKIGTYAGTTPLMAAAGVNWVFDQTYDEGQKNLLEAVRLCYELGLSVNDANSMGITAVMGAANRGSDQIIEFLVSKGANLDVKDKENRTPLIWAEGVFLATHPAKAKPSSIALIQKLMATAAAAK